MFPQLTNQYVFTIGKEIKKIFLWFMDGAVEGQVCIKLLKF